MRTMQGGRLVGGCAVVLGCVAILHLAGCSWSVDYTELGYGQGVGSSTSSGPPPDPRCDADPTINPGAVIDECGVFVSASAEAGGDGTKARPFKSFAEVAANLSTKRRVYACAEAYEESSGIAFSDGVEIYGGFTGCDGDWRWSDEKATLTVTVDEPQPEARSTIALTLNGGDNRLRSLNVVANGPLAQGNSSIALLVNGGKAQIVNAELTAGDAGDGDPGISPLDDPTMLNGIEGSKGEAACDAGLHPGNEGPSKQCTTGGSSTGGRGGAGGTVTDMGGGDTYGPGGAGGSGMPESPRGGAGGVGQTSQSASGACAPGSTGAPGDEGGPGERPGGRGKLDAAGYTGVDGANGKPGTPGQGGGGGGGAMGGEGICGSSGTAVSLIGASGGSGGSGGCGGSGGVGGQAGGSSIAIVILDAEVDLDSVTLTAGDAGHGGQGSNGQGGGEGGAAGGSGSGRGSADPSCAGGVGGLGGRGGPGGGGYGGHSLGIAFKGTPPVGEGITFVPGTEGRGGPGGTDPPADNVAGDNGLSEACWNFDTNSAMGCPGASQQ
ncbi:hypothetical protein SOCE26_021200 [Sorangium cellulosum]|uniref:PE-PGRS family protein n=1 Tax=Sorangium cellulosum TaxID=56 RepID=A0A2L0EN42_SORCE|nr:hypothetical protein SOCE26_021200 [Sorangium cellulosum]